MESIALGTLIAICGYFIKRLIDTTDSFKKDTKHRLEYLVNRSMELEKKLTYIETRFMSLDERIIQASKDFALMNEEQVTRIIDDKAQAYIQETSDFTKKQKQLITRITELYVTLQKDIEEQKSNYGKVKVVEQKLDQFFELYNKARKKD
jgi:predicted transcriptional regulator